MKDLLNLPVVCINLSFQDFDWYTKWFRCCDISEKFNLF